jgi:hypothetical protein
MLTVLIVAWLSVITMAVLYLVLASLSLSEDGSELEVRVEGIAVQSQAAIDAVKELRDAI